MTINEALDKLAQIMQQLIYIQKWEAIRGSLVIKLEF